MVERACVVGSRQAVTRRLEAIHGDLLSVRRLVLSGNVPADEYAGIS